MFFNSYIFILLFLPLVLIGYFGLNSLKKDKLVLIYLIGMSLWFCAYQNLTSLIVLLISILLNYGIKCLMDGALEMKRKRLYLVAGILTNLGILFCFKYYNFFIENVNAVFHTELPFWQLALPLGISFYTFMQISFLVDSYRGECPKTSFWEYVAYVSFFPKLIQGPIVRCGDFLPQLQDHAGKKPDFVNLSRGIYAFSLGLAKKVLLADTLAKIVNIGYNNIEALNSGDALLVMVCYSLQIYFDFSGYCDMAYGIGYALNIRLPINFNSPYKATSISDFWDRWHMTLTKFFTRYLYIPLGGSRKGNIRTLINIMIIFVVSGLWHGASWTFVIWGALNGILMVFERVAKVENWKLPKLIKQIIAFTLTTFAWSIFRAPAFGQVVKLWKQLFTGGFGRIYQPITDCFNDLLEVKLLTRAGLGTVTEAYPWLIMVVFVAVLVIACFAMKNTEEKATQLKLNNRKFVTVVGLLLWSILSLSEITEFIYVNF